MYANMMLIWIIITVGIMNIFLIARHTRADEEKGRAELIRSLPVGRLSVLNAAMITAVIVNALLGLLIGLGLAAIGVESMDLSGSMLYGALICASGLAFAAITALFCQLSSGKGGAMGLSFFALGAFYMMRAAGDMNSEVLACISPIGLAARSQAYVNNYWNPCFILLLEAAVIAAIAFKLNAARDLEQGYIPARPGRGEASAALRSSFGLAFRLLRNTIIVWAILMFVLGASYASIIGDIDAFIGDSPQYLELLGMPPALAALLSDSYKTEMIQKYYLAFVTAMMTLVSTIPLLIIALKPMSEEQDHRAEHSLARTVPRAKYQIGRAHV
jgi:ABC-2 type transport system permease protein